MVKYEVIIYWSREDEAFIAEVPELPGCAAAGSTYQEALDNVQVVIREWIETAKELGREIPDPKVRLSYARIRKGYLSADLCHGEPGSAVAQSRAACWEHPNPDRESGARDGSVVQLRATLEA